MPPELPDHVHEPQVRSFAVAQDWAGLILYWLAHDYQDALQEAIVLLEGDRARRPYYHNLLILLQGMLERWDDPRAVADELRATLEESLEDGSLNASEESAMKLLILWPEWRLCELPQRASRNSLERGVRAAKEGLTVCGDDNPEIQARLLVVLAQANGRLGNFVIAENYLGQALTLYENLIPSQPELYASHAELVREALNGLKGGWNLRRLLDRSNWLSTLSRTAWVWAMAGCCYFGVPLSDPRFYLIIGSSGYLGYRGVKYIEMRARGGDEHESEAPP